MDSKFRTQTQFCYVRPHNSVRTLNTNPMDGNHIESNDDTNENHYNTLAMVYNTTISTI